MLQREQHSTVRKLLESRLVIALEVVMLIGLSFAVSKEIVRKYQVQTEIKQLEQKMSEMQKQNTELTGLIQYLDSNEYKEEQARLKLGLQKPGESVAAVLGASTETAVATTHGQQVTRTEAADATTNPQRWWNRFFNNKQTK
ncbi:MAG: septum formation initiator family protein [Patescibacteria group bacterium]|nr:septum formation initiator family protein [Patescibacteria group bacterium]MDD5716000.1 septum formation initiator family protein [Patescibacteria group bacterium]